MKKSKLSINIALLAALAGGSFPTTTQADTLNLNPSADTFVRFGTNQNVNFGTSAFYDIFQNGTARNYFAYVRFDLSSLPAGAVIDSATLTFTYNGGGTRTDTLNTGRLGVYGLLDVAGNTPQNWGETTLVFSGGTQNVGSEYIANGGTSFDTTTRTISFDGVGEFVTGGGGVGSTAGLNTTTALVDFLQDRFESVGGSFATFIVDSPTTDAGRGYALGSREAVSGFPVLQINYTAVPEPSTFAALAGMLGLGFAASRRRRKA